MHLKIRCYYKFFDAEIFNNCYNEPNFSKKFLLLGHDKRATGILCARLNSTDRLKKYEKFTSSPTADF